MKKRILCITLFILSLLLISCSNNDDINQNDNAIHTVTSTITQQPIKSVQATEIPKTSETLQPTITPTPVEVSPVGTDDQAEQQAMKRQWYMFKRLFVSEDGLHTFSMGWYDDGTLECVFDGHFRAAIVEEVENSSSENVIVYEGEENGGSVKITYYYDREKIEINDLLGLEMDYSGFYCLDESSVIEPD